MQTINSLGPDEGPEVPRADASGPTRLLRLGEVMGRVGLRRSAIYQRMKEGRFPQSRSLGPRCTVWVESEIEAWVKRVVSDVATCSRGGRGRVARSGPSRERKGLVQARRPQGAADAE